MSHNDCKKKHTPTSIHLKVNGMYVKAGRSAPNHVQLRLEDEQEPPEYVQRYTCISQDKQKKYVAFCFTHDSNRYSLTLEGEDLKLVPYESVEHLGWFEMENTGGGETHYMKTTAGLISIKDEKLLTIGGNVTATFTQETSS